MGAAAAATVIPAALSTVIPNPRPSFPRKRESRTVLPYDGIVGKQLRDSRLRGNDGKGCHSRPQLPAAARSMAAVSQALRLLPSARAASVAARCSSGFIRRGTWPE